MGSGYSSLPAVDESDAIMASTSTANPVAGKYYALPSTSSNVKKQSSLHPPIHNEGTINWLDCVRPGLVVSCSSDQVALNNLDTGKCLMRWRGHEREVNKVVYKRVGCKHFVISASRDSTIRLWHFNSPHSSAIFSGHPMSVTGLTPLEDEKFASVSRDGSLLVWDLNRCDAPIRKCASKDNTNLATHLKGDTHLNCLYQTAENGPLRVWDSRDLSLVHRFPSIGGHAQWSCDSCPKRELCITAGSNEVAIYDLRARKLLRVMVSGHEGDARCALFLDHPQQLNPTWQPLALSVGSDRAIKLWDCEEGRCLWTETLACELNAAVVSSADGRICVGGGSGTLGEVRLLCRAGRPILRFHYLQQGNHEA